MMTHLFQGITDRHQKGIFSKQDAKSILFYGVLVKRTKPFDSIQYDDNETSLFSNPQFWERTHTMSNTTNIDYIDSDGTGTVTLVANPFDKGGKYYAKFDRTTINVDHLIARIQKKEVGTNAIMAKHIASLFKAEILEALGRGEAVNLFDLGTLYITASGKVKGETPETATIPGFQVKFTSSKITNDAVSSLGIKKIVMADSSPIIGAMTDLYTNETGTTFTAGKAMRIEGSRLKITGDDGGIFFAPATEKGEPAADEAQWLKIPNQIRNTAKLIEFFLPPELAPGTSYCIVLKTNSTSGKTTRKTYSIAYSDAVTIVE